MYQRNAKHFLTLAPPNPTYKNTCFEQKRTPFVF